MYKSQVEILKYAVVLFYEEGIFMQTWMFMLGIQMIIFIICAVWVGVWMNRDKDEYDEALEKIAKAELEKNANDQ